MDNDDNKYYFLALNRVPSVGPRTVQKLIRKWPRLKEMFALSPAEWIQEGMPKRLAMLLAGCDFAGVEEDLNWARADNHHLLTWCDDAYPALLKHIHDPPLVLYARGHLACLQKKKLAMVGTRKPSITGSETAKSFAFDVAQQGICVVSGLALGIDAQAHRGCLLAGGSTIAVMATGIDRIYPRSHVSLAEEITQNGLLLSELPLKTPSLSGHFPRRNRIISGLSSMTLIIEAAMKSGSLITARLALEQNRDVLAVPGSIHNPQATGCHYLLQQGASLITSSQEVLEALGSSFMDVHVQNNREALASENRDLVKCIGFEITTVDQIIARSGLTYDTAMCQLAELELQGLVQAVSGGYTRG